MPEVLTKKKLYITCKFLNKPLQINKFKIEFGNDQSNK